MPDLVTVRIDMGEVERMIRAGDRVYTQAAASSLNRSVRKERTQAVREIAEEANIQPRKLVRSRMKLRRATRNRLMATLAFLTRPIPAIRLRGARDVYPGGAVAAGRSWPHAFKRRGRGGVEQIFERTGEFHKRDGRQREKIDAIKIPIGNIAERVMRNRIGHAARHLKEILPKELLWRMRSRGAR